MICKSFRINVLFFNNFSLGNIFLGKNRNELKGSLEESASVDAIFGLMLYHHMVTQVRQGDQQVDHALKFTSFR